MSGGIFIRRGCIAWLLAWASLGAWAAAPAGAESASPDGLARAEAEVQPAVEPSAPPAPRADLSLAARATLAPAAKALQATPVASEPGTPLQVGFPRAVPAFATTAAVASQLAWEALGDGKRVAVLTVSSPGASALRAGVRVQALPADATLRFYAPGSEQVFATSGRDVSSALERNLAAGDTTAEARTYWSPVVEGQVIAIEVELPANASTGDLAIAVPSVSHLFATPRDDFALAKAASTCNLDSMCYQGTWSTESNAVSRLVFTDTGVTYVCSGTLLADKDTSTFIPYFLTANHCIPNQTVASTLQNYWFYRSTACNSGVRGPFQTTYGGGTLLYAAGATDTSFLRLNSQPPSGVGYAGWIVGTQNLGAAVTGIHHPAGDLQKISFGSLAAYWTCTSVNADQFDCIGASGPASTFYSVGWTRGITEGGSSGSGLFLDNGRYLVGQLYGGSGTCTTPSGDYYGRFDVAYNAALSTWLGTASAPAFTPSQNYSDLWWNPSQSGWGLSITQHGSAVFAAWYVYDSQGRPTWMVMPGGQWTSATSFSGEIFAATGPDPTAGFFDASKVVRNRVGTGTLRFTSSSQATFATTVNGVSESRSIERQPFAPGSTAVTNGFGDLWWNASESGWGLSVHQQDQTLFAVWYSYRADGSPSWYVMPGGTWTSSDTYTGTLYRTSESPGGFVGTTFNPSNVTRTAVGRLTLRFLDPANALMTYTVDGAFGTKSITRQPF